MSDDQGVFGLVHRSVRKKLTSAHRYADLAIYNTLCELDVDGDGVVEISLQDLAAESDTAPRTLKRGLVHLRTEGIIETQTRRDEHGGFLPTRYRLVVLTAHFEHRASGSGGSAANGRAPQGVGAAVPQGVGAAVPQGVGHRGPNPWGTSDPRIKETDYTQTKNALSPPRASAREPAPTASPHTEGAHDGDEPAGCTPLPRTILQVYRRRCGADPPAALCAELRDQLAAVGELGLCRMIDEAADSCGGVVSVGSVRVARLKHEQETALGGAADQHGPPRGTERRRAGGWGRRGGDGTGAPGAARATREATAAREPPEPTEADPIWRAALHELRLVLTPDNYTRWLARTRVREAAEDHLTVEVATSMQRDWLGTKLAARIKGVLSDQGKPDLRIEYVVAPALAGAEYA